MPAYRERVYICPNQSGQPGWIMDFPLWWDRQEFFKKYSSRQIDTGNPIYVDFAMLLTAGEAIAWDRRCREQLTQNARSKEPILFDAMQHWESMLESASWVIVEMYEWESGLS